MENGLKFLIWIIDGNKKINVGIKLDEKNFFKIGFFVVKIFVGIWFFFNGKVLFLLFWNVFLNVV